MKRILSATIVIAALTGVALAQSRSEIQVQQLNREMQLRGEQIQQQQQTQFEINQLRIETQRNLNFPQAGTLR